jgi:hypothetical protein
MTQAGAEAADFLAISARLMGGSSFTQDTAAGGAVLKFGVGMRFEMCATRRSGEMLPGLFAVRD